MAYTQARVDAALDGANSGVAWAILHDADPGVDGTAGQAAEASPVAVTLPASSSGASSDLVTFNITGAGGPYNFISLWDDSAGAPGTFYGSGSLTPAESFSGAGTLDVTINTTASSP